tara:strand:+ start:142 stop:702 length:561 start_codon:yes stop_codon:yes gene_type:complete
VAAGALHALEEHKLMRVAIVDLDVHHGNGTQEIVMEHSSPDRIFFFSVHLYDHTPTPAKSNNKRDSASKEVSQYEFYPGTGSRDRMEHNIVNAPLLPLWRRERGNNASNQQQGGDKKKNGTSKKQSKKEFPVFLSLVIVMIVMIVIIVYDGFCFFVFLFFSEFVLLSTFLKSQSSNKSKTSVTNVF